MADAWVGLDAAFAELEAELTDVARGLTVRVFNGILSKTPQYLGRMAASWTYSVGSPQFVDRSALVDSEGGQGVHTHLGYYRKGVTPLQRGSPVAIGIAKLASAGRDKSFKLGDIVYLANGVNHGEGPYSQAVEDGNVTLRAENRPGAPAQRTVDWAGAYYQDITPNKARELKSLTIGKIDASSDS